MKNTAYLQNVQTLRENIYKTRFDEIESLGLLGTYMTVSANLLTYLPHLSSNDHYNKIQDIQFHRALSNVDQYYLSLLGDLKVFDKANVIKQSLDVSHIFVTYHTGSYRMFIQYLTRQNVPFCLVTEKRFINDQGRVVQKIFKEMKRDQNAELEILAAENPRLIFELTSKLRNGTSVVFYIDGNTGVTEKKLNDNNNLLKINFLNNHLYARQGIAFLAYLSRAPLAVAIAKRKKNLSNTIRIKPIDTKKLIEKKERNNFINTVTKKLYKELELFLTKYPEQWEGWFYVDKFFNRDFTEQVNEEREIPDFSKPATLILDQFAHLFKYDSNNFFLITRRDYKFLQITNSLYETLNFFKKPRQIIPDTTLVVNQHEVDLETLMELIKMKLLNPIQ